MKCYNFCIVSSFVALLAILSMAAILYFPSNHELSSLTSFLPLSFFKKSTSSTDSTITVVFTQVQRLDNTRTDITTTTQCIPKNTNSINRSKNHFENNPSLNIHNSTFWDQREYKYQENSDGSVVVTVDGRGLTALPALTDPHVHFRTPGHEHKEDWRTASRAAIAGGVTTVFDMPNNVPFIYNSTLLRRKRDIIEHQLHDANIPLRFGLYVHPDPQRGNDGIEEAAAAVRSGAAIGVKVYIGASTGGVRMGADHPSLPLLFQYAARDNFTIVVHAETQHMLDEARHEFFDQETESSTHQNGHHSFINRERHQQLKPQVRAHSIIRPELAAVDAVRDVLSLAEKYGNRLYIAHVSTSGELELIRDAKRRGVDVWAEACPHHLFLSDADYERWGTWVQVNPPMRSADHVQALWRAIRDGTIDVISTDHAPHTKEEKARNFPYAPSGIPSIENYLALLLDAYNKGQLTLDQITKFTSDAPESAFRLPPTQDLVLVDLEAQQIVDMDRQCSKAHWTPYSGRQLKGWPQYTILNGHVFKAGGCPQHHMPKLPICQIKK